MCNSQCCYTPPIPKSILEIFKTDIVNQFSNLQYLGDSPFGKDNVIPLTANKRCPFLRDDNKCNIYKHRPKICQMFGEKIECKLSCMQI